MTQDNQTTFDFFVPQETNTDESQKLIDQHNRQFSTPSSKPKWSADKTLELLNAADARAHAVLHLRGMLSVQLKSAMTSSPSPKVSFLHTLSSEVSLKTVTQDVSVIVRNAALFARARPAR